MLLVQGYQNGGAEGGGDFARSVNPISTRGKIMPPTVNSQSKKDLKL